MICAIDIGGTKTLLAVFNETGEIIDSLKFASNNIYSLFLSDLKENITKLSYKNFEICVIGRPGTITRDGTNATNFGNLLWSNLSLSKDLEEIFKCTVLEENDANLAGLSEASLINNGQGKILYITISTGIGGGYVINGILDPNTINAEIGAILFERDSKILRWEDIASGKAIVKKYSKKASEIKDENTWNKIAYDIAIGMYNSIRILTPDIIVIGGGVGAHFEKFKEPLEHHLQSFKTDLVLPKITKAKHAEEAVIYGCYRLAHDYIKNRK
jgi:predicted NBD/HSP70 family sugar kinase